jgi:hypothetical protein
MNQNLQAKSKDLAVTVGLYVLWGLLAAMWLWLAFELYTLLIYLGILIVQTPSLTPPGWNSSTIVGLSKCSVLVLGALWLGVALFTHHQLQRAREDRQLLVKAGRTALIIVGIYLFSAAMLYLLG